MITFPGLKVFLVEDEGIVAFMIEEMLEELGCEVVASVAELEKARDVAARIDAGIAILDVNVAGQLIFPVAEILGERGIPFIFSTGYGSSLSSGEFAGRQILSKPFSQGELEQKITATLASSTS